VRKGIWRREENRGHEIKGKTFGILGYGYMGSSMHEKLKGFGCNILVYDKYLEITDETVKQVKLEVLFQEADIISVHIPFTEENQFWLNQEFWAKFKKPIYVINTARGDVLKISHLMDAIEDGKILGACLDVLEFEKSSFENLDGEDKMPPDFVRLINSDKVILSPHIAGWTFESYDKLAKAMVSKILALD
jgi:D-3-phosphoglycerate dehydrogenase